MPAHEDVFRMRWAAGLGKPPDGRGARLVRKSLPWVQPAPARAAPARSRRAAHTSASSAACPRARREDERAARAAEKAAAAGRSVRDKTTFACRMQQTFGSDAIKAAFKETLGLAAARPGRHLSPGPPGAGAPPGRSGGGADEGGCGGGGCSGGCDGSGGGGGGGAAAATLAAAACPARRRPVRENLHDFLAKKRQIFLVQVHVRGRCVQAGLSAAGRFSVPSATRRPTPRHCSARRRPT
jgi:hypothetical protein